MSVTPQPPAPISGLGKFILIATGVVLLIPGLCSAGIMIFFGAEAASNSSGMAEILLPLLLLWAVCFAISYGGYRLIRMAFR